MSEDSEEHKRLLQIRRIAREEARRVLDMHMENCAYTAKGGSTDKIIHLGSVVYLRYVDHVLFRNMANPIDVPIHRETIGWLTNETSDTVRIQWDKTRKSSSNMNDSPHSGLVLLKSCILEIRALPLQDFLRRPLSCWNPKDIITECAFQTKERKTQERRNRTGANP